MDYKTLKRTVTTLLDERNKYKDSWCRCAKAVHPTAYSELLKSENAEIETFHFCETAAESCQTLASGHSSLITPSTARWFDISSPLASGGSQSDEVETWTSQASGCLWEAFSSSTFQSVISQVYLDRCGIGHAAAHVTLDEASGELLFTHIPAGSFAFARDKRKKVNTFVREFDLTPHEAVDTYGIDKVGKRIAKAYENESTKYTEKFRFYHIVLPNPKGQKGLVNRKSQNRLWTEYTITADDDQICQEEGLYEFPFMVTTFLQWGSNPYGIAPTQLCLDSIRRLNMLEKLLDELGLKALTPPLAVPVKMVGKVDLRPGRTNPIPEEYLNSAYPRELTSQARYDIGLERVETAKGIIRSVFYYEIVRPLASLTQEMTAQEVRMRVSENTTNFIHSFSQLVNDLMPFIETCFTLLYRWGLRNKQLGEGGVMPEMPLALAGTMVEPTEDGEDFYLPHFGVQFTSRMAIALKEANNESDMAAVSYIADVATRLQQPDILDNLDSDEAVRLYFRNVNASTSLLRPKGYSKVLSVEQLRQQRAEIQMQQMQMQQMEGLASSADKASSAISKLQ